MSGESFYTDFTVDNADLAQMLTISFDHDTSSDSAYNDGDIKIKVIQDPLGTPKTISVNGEDLRAAKGSHIAQFQTDHTIKDYRLVFEYVTAEANILAIKVDNIQVGPREVAKGAAMSDSIAFTPEYTSGSGSISSSTGFYKRVGDSVYIQVSTAFNGSGGSGSITLEIQDSLGIVPDMSKISNATVKNIGGGNWYDDSGGNGSYIGANIKSINAIEFVRGNGSSNTLRGSDVANNDVITFTARIPIQGIKYDHVGRYR
jgi:hypothetical protein